MPVNDLDPAAFALDIVELAQRAQFSEIERHFAPRLLAVVSAETLAAGWAGEIAKSGSVVSVGPAISEPGPEPGLVLVTVSLICERGGLSVAMSLDEDGAMHGLLITPSSSESWRAPSYAKPRRFTEREVVLGDGPLAVSGTLTMPRRGAGHPGVVLLSGGGEFDRDETSGPNKPLKDLAWGLASRGVAVLRFDKVTFANRDAIAEPGFTMTEEYVPHAVAAIRVLQRESGVDAASVFLVGHSMGGRVAPRVAATEPSVAGLVVLAGDTEPMQRAIVRVARYLASTSPDAVPESLLAELTRQAAAVDSPDLTPETPTSDLPFGWPPSYWLDLRDDDPVRAAAAMQKPMLILQGGRDYQVTEADDLVGWRNGLAGQPGVTIRVLPADDHLFFGGTGLSRPEDYARAQHMDKAVIGHVARWVKHLART
jgi:dienelactone hydrolase